MRGVRRKTTSATISLAHGKAELESQLRYSPAMRDRLLNFFLKHPQLVYFGGVASVVSFLLAVLVACLTFVPGSTGAGIGFIYPSLVVLAVLAAVLPTSDIAVSLVNYWLGWLMPPRVLPKLLFKDGVPEDCATFVVMPTLLIRPRSAAVLLERLEVHYLANPDPHLRFALLTDFADAPAEHMPEDEAYLQAALDGVRALERSLLRRRAGSLLRLPPPPPLESDSGLLDGLGTEARQADGVQPPASRRHATPVT